MLVSPMNSGLQGDSAQVRGPGGSLGKQEFLQLLVAQLRNQDPLRPMEDREFIAQLAQLTTLETIQHLSTTMESLLGAQLLDHSLRLLGHQVEARLPTGDVVTGTVQALHLEGADILLDLGDQVVYLADVVRVGAPTATSDAPEPSEASGSDPASIDEGAQQP